MGCGCDGVKKIVDGVTGLAKAALGVGAAAPEVAKFRRDVCRGCEHATRNADPRFAVNGGLTTLSQCRECSCLIGAKTKLAGEACPLNKWGAVPPPP